VGLRFDCFNNSMIHNRRSKFEKRDHFVEDNFYPTGGVGSPIAINRNFVAIVVLNLGAFKVMVVINNAQVSVDEARRMLMTGVFRVIVSERRL
jgi:hypothetical protein